MTNEDIAKGVNEIFDTVFDVSAGFKLTAFGYGMNVEIIAIEINVGEKKVRVHLYGPDASQFIRSIGGTFSVNDDGKLRWAATIGRTEFHTWCLRGADDGENI